MDAKPHEVKEGGEGGFYPVSPSLEFNQANGALQYT